MNIPGHKTNHFANEPCLPEVILQALKSQAKLNMQGENRPLDRFLSETGGLPADDLQALLQQTIYNILSISELFDSFQQDELFKISRLAELRAEFPGKIIFQEGEPAEDLYLIFRHLMERNNELYAKNVLRLEQEAHQRIMSYDWPGNYEELATTIERGVKLAQGETLLSEDLFFDLKPLKGKLSFDLLKLEPVTRVVKSKAYPGLGQGVTGLVLLVILFLGFFGSSIPAGELSLSQTWLLWPGILALFLLSASLFIHFSGKEVFGDLIKPDIKKGNLLNYALVPLLLGIELSFQVELLLLKVRDFLFSLNEEHALYWKSLTFSFDPGIIIVYQLLLLAISVLFAASVLNRIASQHQASRNGLSWKKRWPIFMLAGIFAWLCIAG